MTFLTSFWAVFQDTREACTCTALPKARTINVLMRENDRLTRLVVQNPAKTIHLLTINKQISRQTKIE